MGHPALYFCWWQEEQIEERFFVAALLWMTAEGGAVVGTLGRWSRFVGEELVMVQSGGRAAALQKGCGVLLVELLQNLPPC